MVRSIQHSVPVAYVRGGTSKAMFFHEKDIPSPGPQRDSLLKRAMGSPDPLQIDGMGGTKAVTSKIAIIRKSDRSDADIDYTFAQVGVRDDSIDYTANCGNISSGVGPFAIDENLIEKPRDGVSLDPKVKTQEVRIFNTGTKKVLVAHVPIDEEGASQSQGDYAISGVPRTGAPILMDYRYTAGASQGKGPLPSGNPIDTINVRGKEVNITICDFANICIFANAKDLGISGHETAESLTENAELIAKCLELRGKAAQLVGMCKDWERVDEQAPFMPMPILVSESSDPAGHLSARLFLDNMCHPSMAGTGSICTAAASRTPGTVVNNVISQKHLQEDVLKINHPIGIMPVFVQTESAAASGEIPAFKTLSFVRTSRRIMDGKVYVPKSVMDQPNGVNGTNKATAANGINGTAKTNGVSSAQERPPVTEHFARFVNETGFSSLSDEVKAKLKELLLDFVGVTAGAADRSESTPAIYKGILKMGAENGTSTVLAKGQKFSPHYAALLNAAFGHSFDFDDTYAEGVLHAGVTAIGAGLTEAETSHASTEKLMTALAVGYEVTCRLGKALGPNAYERGFHNTATAGIFGAVATLTNLRGSSRHVIEMAFGLAGSKAAGSMQYLDNGSWNKRLHPGFAAHDAFLCVSLAEAGVIGATRIFEGKRGFLNAYTPKTKIDWAALVHGLGKDWVFMETALKPFPACRMTHGFIELAGNETARAKASGKKVEHIEMAIAPSSYNIVCDPIPNKTHPENSVDAQFSAYYQTAIAWLDGPNTGWAAYDRMQDKDVYDMLDRISAVIDEKLSSFGCRLDIRFTDGTSTSVTLPEPLGEASNPFVREKVEEKFFSMASPVYGKERATMIRDQIDAFEAQDINNFMSALK